MGRSTTPLLRVSTLLVALFFASTSMDILKLLRSPPPVAPPASRTAAEVRNDARAALPQLQPQRSVAAATSSDDATSHRSIWNPRSFPTSTFPVRNGAEDDANDDGDAARLKRLRALTGEIHRAPQCRALGPQFAQYVADYITNVHAAATDEPLSPNRADSDSSKKLQDRRRAEHRVFWGRQRRLIYSCESHKRGRFCGGMGDRFRGIATTFFLALLTKRKFELFHPVPVPLQELLPPRLLNWIPTSASGAAEPTAADVEAEMARFEPDLRMMRLKGHKGVLGTLVAAEAAARWQRGEDATIRMQTNSFGVDGYLPRFELLQRRKTEDMGLAAGCNISCYFGCLHHILFRRSAELGSAMRDVLAPMNDGVAAGSLSSSPFEHPFSPLQTTSGEDATTGGNEGDARPVAVGGAQRRLGALLSVQVRMGGSWASCLRIPEPFRTQPAAVRHFFSVIDELRSGGVPGLEFLRDAAIFISSDSQRLINETVARFGADRVLYVKGDTAFCHTDTMNLNEVRPEKYAKVAETAVRDGYLRTLLNHMLIGEGDHVVMAQSGFGDTAFWRGRRTATGIFVDMTNNRLAWQHHLSYTPIGHALGDRDLARRLAAEHVDADRASAAFAVRNRVIDINSAPSKFYP